MDAQVVWREGHVLAGQGSRAALTIAPREAQAEAFGAKELVLLGLGGCTGLDVVYILEKMRVSPAAFAVEVHAEEAEEHPKYLKSFTLTYRFQGESLPPEHIVRAVELSMDRYCGVSRTLSGVASIRYRIVIGEEEVKSGERPALVATAP